MTSPVPHGYPDFGRTFAQADKLYISTTEAVNGTETYARIFVGDYPHLGLHFRPAVDHFAGIVTFYDAQTGGNRLTSFPFSVRESTTLETTIPVGGPWAELQLAPFTGTGSMVYRMWSSHSPHVYRSTNYNGGILASVDQAVGAGATATVAISEVYVGQVHWSVETPLTSWTARVETIDYAGAVLNICPHRATAAGAEHRLLYLPAINTQISLVNGTGGGGNFRVAMVARPLESGR